MISTKRRLIERMIAGAATATVALGLLGAVPAALASDHDQDDWWYNNHKTWQGNDNWPDNNVGWRYRTNWNYAVAYRYAGGRPYYYAPPPVYYHSPPAAHASPPPVYGGASTASFGFTF